MNDWQTLVVNRGMVDRKFPIVKTEIDNGNHLIYFRKAKRVYVGLAVTEIGITKIIAHKLSTNQQIEQDTPITVGKPLRKSEDVEVVNGKPRLCHSVVCGRKRIKMKHKTRERIEYLEPIPCEKMPVKAYGRLKRLEKSREQAGIGLPDVTENIGKQVVDYFR